MTLGLQTVYTFQRNGCLILFYILKTVWLNIVWCVTNVHVVVDNGLILRSG